MWIKIPSHFLRVGWASRQQAEHACFLHMLVMCSLPRTEVVQKTPGNCPEPSQENLPAQGATSQPGQRKAEGLCPASMEEMGALGAYDQRGLSSRRISAPFPEAGDAQQKG